MDREIMEYSLEAGLPRIRDLALQQLTVDLLHLFLPLDIDMQALEMICNDINLMESEKIKKIRDYLLNNEIGMLKDTGVNYLDKLKKAQEMVKSVEELHSNPVLQKLLCIDDANSGISGFLKLLDDKKTAVKNGGSINNKDIEEIIRYFGKGGGWQIEGAKKLIISFHDWYCALAECLRGERVCKE